LSCHIIHCEQSLKKALYIRTVRKVLYIIETMLRWFVRMPTGVVPVGERFYWGKVPVGERFYWGKVPVGVAMDAKKGVRCVCACGGLGEELCPSDDWECA
jgi:hypothetical protein